MIRYCPLEGLLASSFQNKFLLNFFTENCDALYLTFLYIKSLTLKIASPTQERLYHALKRSLFDRAFLVPVFQ